LRTRWQEEARLFEELHSGIRVELASVSIRELYRSTLTEGGLREGRFDIALLVTDWLSEGLATGALENLAAVAVPVSDSRLAQWLGPFTCSADHLRRDISPHCHGMTARSASSIAAISSPILTARLPIAAQFGRDLAPPVTWQQFEETARFLTDPASWALRNGFCCIP
jgi:multiple sugar transport system substrate-binding protein